MSGNLNARHKDSRRRLIEIGQRVAYNRSGDVIEGRVVQITRSEVRIQCHADFARTWAGTGGRWSNISRVKNGRSILVLDPA